MGVIGNGRIEGALTPAEMDEVVTGAADRIAPDGRRLYFGSEPPDGRGPGIWVAEREGNGWGAPRFHGPGMFASSTLDGDLFMASIGRGGPGGIVSYPKDDAGWGPSERLGGGVNQPRPFGSRTYVRSPISVRRAIRKIRQAMSISTPPITKGASSVMWPIARPAQIGPTTRPEVAIDWLCPRSSPT